MSATGAAQTAEQRSNEPSMEEILASIRRIIADDQATQQAPSRPLVKPAPMPVAPPPLPPAPPPAKAPPPPAPPPPVEDVLDLAEVAAIANDLQAPEPITFDDPEPESPATLTAESAIAAPMSDPTPSDDELLSAHARHAATSAFQSLTRTVLVNSGRTLDDIVSDMMRPMLREWLDDNLPGIVERLVRAEIERVARGGR